MASKFSYLIVGAGFSGAVLARELATHTGKGVLVLDSRSHIGGNCHTERDGATGVMVHQYGPHIFNTNHEDVWKYVQRFGTFRPFVNRVKALNGRGVFGLPINLLTINQFFGKTMNPAEARAFVASLGDQSIIEPRSFEEQALKFLGAELYQAFFYGYTKKQWGCEPSELPASILKRLPVRFNYDDNYYATAHQGIPEEGYTEIIRRILDVPGVEVQLEASFEPAMLAEFEHVFYSGPVDAFFGHHLGRLPYRTVTFERIEAHGDLQGNAVINYTEQDVRHTRVHEHKHFTPWESHEKTVAFREYSKQTEPHDVPYYPIRMESDVALFEAYAAEARQQPNVSFIGRLGTYRYLDMDQVIGEALDFSCEILNAIGARTKVPVFGPKREKAAMANGPAKPMKVPIAA
jgi:UDP-galactopyranose mutase